MRRVKRGVQNTEVRMQNSECGTTTPNSEHRTPNSKGFTLIEIVITIVLISIISGIAAMIILQGVRAYSDERNRSDVHYQARLAMERMAREIRMIRSRADITTMANADLQFTDVYGNTVRFNLVGSDIQRSGSVLASNISPFAFSYYDTAGALTALSANLWLVEIALTATQGTETIQMRTRVHPRNF